MTAPKTVPDSDFTSFALARHAQRRQNRIPTLSVLGGPLVPALQVWRCWCATQNLVVVQHTYPDSKAAIICWTAAVARRRNLISDAAVFVSACSGIALGEIQSRLNSMTLYDLELFWGNLVLDSQQDGAARVGHWLLRQHVVGRPLTPELLAGQLDDVLAGWDQPWRRVLVALAALLPTEALPTLLLHPPVDVPDALSWFVGAAHFLTTLVTAVPRLPASLAIDRPTLRRFVEHGGESQARALVREGLLSVAYLTENQIVHQLQAQGVPTDELASQLHRLATDGATEELVASFSHTVQVLKKPATAAADEEARSAAERFLFDRLESLPQTAGLFELNGQLDFYFGPKRAEVDLLARGLRLAVEIDGYFHFREPEGYRRDRRKDWELQRRGYRVLRFLAEDVVPHMEEIFNTITDAIALCQSSPVF